MLSLVEAFIGFFSGIKSLVLAVSFLILPLSAWAADRINLSHSAISGTQAVLWVTHDAGFFRKYDIEPQIIYVAGGPPNIAALLSGDLDFTIFAGPASIAANLQGADVVVLMSFVNTLDYTMFTLPALKKPADLKNRKIGVARPGASDDYGARVALKRWGLEPGRDVTILAVGGMPERLAALESRRVDAVLLLPPITARARQGGFNELAFLGDLGLDYLGTCLVTTRRYIQRNERVVRRLVQAFVEGIHFYKSRKEESLKSIAKFTRLKDRAALEEAYNSYALKFMAQVPYPNIKGVKAVLDEIAKDNPKARNADPNQFVEVGFLKELEDSGFVTKLYGK